MTADIQYISTETFLLITLLYRCFNDVYYRYINSQQPIEIGKILHHKQITSDCLLKKYCYGEQLTQQHQCLESVLQQTDFTGCTINGNRDKCT